MDNLRESLLSDQHIYIITYYFTFKFQRFSNLYIALHYIFCICITWSVDDIFTPLEMRRVRIFTAISQAKYFSFNVLGRL